MACRALQQPAVSGLVGLTRDEWEQVYDLANLYRDDAAVLRAAEADDLRAYAGRRSPLFRRGGRERQAAKTLAARFRGLFRKDIGGVAGDSDVWVDYDYVAIDGVSGKLGALIDYVDNTHSLVQTVSGSQCPVPAADALLAGAKSAVYSDHFYDSTRPVARWHDHDGLGMTICNVMVPIAPATGAYCGTQLSAGIGFRLGSFFGGATFVVTNGGTAPVNASGGTLVDLTPTYQLATFGSAATPNYAVRLKSAVQSSGAQASVPSSADPQATFRLGKSVTGTLPQSMRHRAIYRWRRALSAAELATLYAWIQRDTGIAP